ncbi:hypothetical protein [Bradyrhizobium sp. HKCCYLRH1062]|uniref:hypothetical protein n=1 Tax=unclassified Bradyrhizobium TaxID=2631580 RepID=UPI003EBD0C83
MCNSTSIATIQADPPNGDQRILGRRRHAEGTSSLFQPTIVSDVAIATVFGFAAAFAVYWWFSKSRGALRFIDLVSFGIGFLAISAGLFAVYGYKSESTKNHHHLTFKLDATEASLDAHFDMLKICDRIPHTPYRLAPIRIAECEKLDQHLKTLKVNDDFPMPLVPPDVASYTDPVVQRLAQNVAKSVADANEVIKAYNEDVAHHGKLTFLEGIFRELALPVLAWAFGLGLGRRTIDLYRDLSETSQQRLRRFSGYSLARPVAECALGYFSTVISAQRARLKMALRPSRHRQ